MSAYVLLIIVTLNGRLASHTVEMDTRTSCEAAANYVRSSFLSQGLAAGAVCVSR